MVSAAQDGGVGMDESDPLIQNEGGMVAAGRPSPQRQVLTWVVEHKKELQALALFIGFLLFGMFNFGTWVLPSLDGETDTTILEQSCHANFVDGLYMSVIILTTVGYGDCTPKDTAGPLIFTTLYVVVGIAIIGYALSIIADTILQRQEEMIMRVMDRKGAETAEESADNFERQERRQRRIKQAACIISLVVVLLVGTLFYSLFDNVTDMTFLDALYFSVITCTTVGFGDFLPITNSQKIFAIFYTLVGTLVTAASLSTFAELFMQEKNVRLLDQITSKELTIGYLEEMDEDGDGQISEMEFVVHQIIFHEKVTKQEVAEIRQAFRQLDEDGSGFLDADDLKLIQEKQEQERAEKLKKV
mmetsp:Transcript_27558/g.76998  ORF Transcript_27558/g.76998 Transcript_27558/m.76998 type:complete len:359 (+) Transcript_27558:66-1142(+)|eukprot:CAMPEP_0119119238 /NCGR_PEP_ID=MMETSP1310-20130426/811_1 /TAXON_ID=464262 /ORGANISM="Genus nov. species nov., Strain RCC2339" /LENGTH=358 /DNA_ID=CAMNT_0007108657 /DNA_START=65 /DNA_END=1141 /DNA_ORIENTATION=+